QQVLPPRRRNLRRARRRYGLALRAASAAIAANGLGDDPASGTIERLGLAVGRSQHVARQGDRDTGVESSTGHEVIISSITRYYQALCSGQGGLSAEPPDRRQRIEQPVRLPEAEVGRADRVERPPDGLASRS